MDAHQAAADIAAASGDTASHLDQLLVSKGRSKYTHVPRSNPGQGLGAWCGGRYGFLSSLARRTGRLCPTCHDRIAEATTDEHGRILAEWVEALQIPDELRALL